LSAAASSHYGRGFFRMQCKRPPVQQHPCSRKPAKTPASFASGVWLLLRRRKPTRTLAFSQQGRKTLSTKGIEKGTGPIRRRPNRPRTLAEGERHKPSLVQKGTAPIQPRPKEIERGTAPTQPRPHQPRPLAGTWLRFGVGG
jgi:hypothetical protein